MKTFTHTGVSTLNGETKIRYANDAMRVKVLAKGGHTDIDLIELPEAMTKEAAALYLVSMDFANGRADVQEALEAELVKRVDAAPKEKAAPKSLKAVKSKPITLETIKAKAAPKAAPKATKTKAQIEAELAKLEDAPF